MTTLVTATVHSVGPYVLTTSASGNRSRSAAAVAVGNVSPQNRNRPSLGSSDAAKPRSANDGVLTQTDTSLLASSSCSRRGLAPVAASTLWSVAPVASEQYRSMTDRSNENGAWLSQTGSVVERASSVSEIAQSTKWASAADVICTPFG